MDNFGELGVISVFGGQIGFPAFVFLDLLSMMMAFFGNEELYLAAEDPIEQARTLGYRFRLISDGIEMGMKAKPLFPVKWEEMLERSLDELRAEFQIEPATEGIYSWYNDPRLESAIA